MEPFSFVVHSYNEADALRRLVQSSLPFTDLFDEWVILDHRSDDHTQDVIRSLKPILDRQGVQLTTLHEERDLSRDHTFADVRHKTVQAARNDLVFLADADFLLGPGFRHYLEQAQGILLGSKRHCAVKFPNWMVWDHLHIDGGSVTDHGRLWWHWPKARLLWRDACPFIQRGKWERIKPPGRRRNYAKLPLLPSAVIGVNVKPPERMALRATMTSFMAAAMAGKRTGNWLDHYQRGELQPWGYRHRPGSIKGERYFIDRLQVQSEPCPA